MRNFRLYQLCIKSAAAAAVMTLYGIEGNSALHHPRSRLHNSPRRQTTMYVCIAQKRNSKHTHDTHALAHRTVFTLRECIPKPAEFVRNLNATAAPGVAGVEVFPPLPGLQTRFPISWRDSIALDMFLCSPASTNRTTERRFSANYAKSYDLALVYDE